MYWFTNPNPGDGIDNGLVFVSGMVSWDALKGGCAVVSSEIL